MPDLLSDADLAALERLAESALRSTSGNDEYSRNERDFGQVVYRFACPKCGGRKRGWRALNSDTQCSYCERKAVPDVS